MNVSADFYDAIDERGRNLLADITLRAEDNDGKTIQPCDLQAARNLERYRVARNGCFSYCISRSVISVIVSESEDGVLFRSTLSTFAAA
jgi:hypothetical protein